MLTSIFNNNTFPSMLRFPLSLMHRNYSHLQSNDPIKKLIISTARNQKRNWDHQASTIVDLLIEKLEPNNYDKIKNSPKPPYELINEGKSNEFFNYESFEIALLRLIAQMSSKIKCPENYMNTLIRLTKKYSEKEIKKSIDDIIPELDFD